MCSLSDAGSVQKPSFSAGDHSRRLRCVWAPTTATEGHFRWFHNSRFWLAKMRRQQGRAIGRGDGRWPGATPLIRYRMPRSLSTHLTPSLGVVELRRRFGRARLRCCHIVGPPHNQFRNRRAVSSRSGLVSDHRHHVRSLRYSLAEQFISFEPDEQSKR